MKTGVPTPQVAPVRAEDLDVDATILICTYNRADDLERTLESLAESAVAGFSWDVLVVDNNSNDRTHDVVDARIASFPVRLRYLFEPRQGKSNALNTGMNAAHAAIIVFTDDDVVVETGWLQAAVQPLLKRRDIGYTGGPVRPIWKASRPSWLDEAGNLGGAIAVMDHGPSSFVFEEQKKTPLGVNMAVRRDVIERIGGFRPELGRNGKSLLGQEQAEFFYRSREAGIRGLYVPAMVLNHVVPASRLTRRYFRRWWYWKGVSHARVHAMHGRTELGIELQSVPRVLGVPRFIVGGAVRHAIGWLRSMVRRDARARTRHWLVLAYSLGYAREVWRSRAAAAWSGTPPRRAGQLGPAVG